jgi:class 3 adenylate cyclase/CHASE3 domain sensor protein
MREWFLNMSIARRLGLGFGALVFLIIAFGLSALYQMDRLKKQGENLFLHPFTVTRAVDEVEIATLKIHRSMKDIAHIADQDKIQSHESQIAAYEKAALQHLETVSSQFLGDPQLVKKVHQSLIDWRPIRDEVIQLRLAGDFNGADAITRGKGAIQVEHIENELVKLKLFAHRQANESMVEAGMIMRESTLIIGLLFVTAVLLGIAIAVPITHSIRKPLTRLDHAATRVSQGDLGQQLEVTSRDELGRLTSTFNFMVVSIREQTEEIHRKNEENERLLLNILPGPIADRLKKGEETIADHFPEVTVLFADIVGFTALSETIPPHDLVTLLNHLFSEFDNSAQVLEIEKIKTIGDCYMAVAGLTNEVDNPPTAMVKMAFEMLSSVELINSQRGISLQIRIGINCGPVIAGVIGKSKFIYDLWGDTVNLASRMESHGVAGRIHISEAIYQRVKGCFKVENRGVINVKGKGEMTTYLIGVGDCPTEKTEPSRSTDSEPSA